ncbi:winged helix-turn-helix transcriptional regulator [Paenibacillus tritici]|uniref:Winged helix-turn-helix transcriptional regulator n=1 Tax=Paenibacillus tritici TaxID=1873425 RepID=A0ABX2DP03_9BACL|nr:winged helix-turn-helix transcriptional regulator [Paenibacillus tritici]NQX46344.1 winged helix-turn-helix transcriptional regulator [Paenibacillus tritici]
MKAQGNTGSSGEAEDLKQEAGIHSLQRTLEVIGGKWKGVLLYHLISGTKRFNELRRLCPGITQRMLAMQLRELERDGLVHREAYPQVPQRVEYSLTEWARGLETGILSIKHWGEEYRELLARLEPGSTDTDGRSGKDSREEAPRSTNIPE